MPRSVSVSHSRIWRIMDIVRWLCLLMGALFVSRTAPTLFPCSIVCNTPSFCSVFQGSLCPACVVHSMDCPNGSSSSSGFGNGCASSGCGGVVNGCSSVVSTVSGSGRIAGEPPSSAVSRSTILTKAKPFPVMGKYSAGNGRRQCCLQVQRPRGLVERCGYIVPDCNLRLHSSNTDQKCFNCCGCRYCGLACLWVEAVFGHRTLSKL